MDEWPVKVFIQGTNLPKKQSNLNIQIGIFMKTAIIIGGGPAGCQCALWLCMLGYQVVIVEQTARLGGLQRESPYPNNWLVGMMNLQGQEVAQNIQTHIEKMEIPVIYNSAIESIKKIDGGFEVKINNEIISTSTIVIATGVRPKPGNFNPAKNILIGPGKKVEEFDFIKKRVAILGGGDNAAENYSFIKEKNPDQCHVYARTVRARDSLWKNVNASDKFVGEYKADQKSMTISCEKENRAYDVFVVLYGWEANIPDAMDLLKGSLLDERNFIFTDEMRRTKVDNLFAAGEVTQRVHPCVVTSMADGVIVAKAIQAQLENKNNVLRCKL